jgi:hypothetical protein
VGERRRYRRSIPVFGIVAVLLGVAAVSALAANIVGTKGNDTLRGTAKADHISGGAGNDKIWGLSGNDVLNGGPGNDVLVGGPGNDTLIGGPGSDVLNCGPGKDTAYADASDKLIGCEVVKGLKSTTPPPPTTTTTTTTTSPSSPHGGHYSGTTSQGKSIALDVSSDGKTITNVAAMVDQQCQELPIPIPNVPINIPGPIQVNADRTFNTTFSYGAGSGLLSGSFAGSFDGAGHASGTLNAEFLFYPQGKATHCPTGNLTWTAQ